MPDQITSTANENVKRVIRLRERKARDKSGLTIIEGEREIAQALDAGMNIQEAYYCGKINEPLMNALKKALKKSSGYLVETNKKVFARLAYGEKEEGVLCVARTKRKTLESLSVKKSALFVILEGVEKPGNIGAIFRSCDAAGVDAVFLTGHATDLYNPNAIRASLGAVFTLNCVVTNNEEISGFLLKNNVKVLAATPNAAKKYCDVDLTGPLALVMGSEDKGLSPFWLKRADQQVLIPMKGAVDSLNVSTSTAVILYEINRQRA